MLLLGRKNERQVLDGAFRRDTQGRGWRTGGTWRPPVWERRRFSSTAVGSARGFGGVSYLPETKARGSFLYAALAELCRPGLAVN